MIRALVVGNIRNRQSNFAEFLDRTAVLEETFFCADLQEMISLLSKRSIDVIYSLENSRNLTVRDIFSNLKKKEEWCDIPVFLFSEDITPEKRINAIEMGAANFLSSRTPAMEISALTQFHVAKKHRIEKLRLSREHLFKRATSDPLTGLHALDYFQTVLEERQQAEVPGANQYAVLVVKPDHFSSINATLGHNFSRKILKSLADALKTICRRGDPLCRLDDDSFGLLLPHVTEQQALVAAERIRKKISGQPMDYPLTVSIGVSARRGKYEGRAEKIIDEACLALKAAAGKGKNRCELFRREMVQSQKTAIPFQIGTHETPVYQSRVSYANL